MRVTGLRGMVGDRLGGAGYRLKGRVGDRLGGAGYRVEGDGGR